MSGVLYNKTRDIYIKVPRGFQLTDRPFTLLAITGDQWRKGRRFASPYGMGSYWLTMGPSELTDGWKRVDW